MAIIVNLDVMLAKRKMRSKELAERIDDPGPEATHRRPGTGAGP